MYVPEYGYNTIKEAQKELLHEILNNGEEVENLLEINNISIFIEHPLKDHEELFKNVTPIAAKHMDQMMLKPNPELSKTHYDRLHNYVVGDKNKHEVGENLILYDQIKECIKRLKENSFSKRCVMTLWSPEDTDDKYALSWVMSQLMIREGKLIMTNFFRGNDIWNAFTFNMLGIANLQAEIAKELGVESGEFIVHIGSAHIYKVHVKEIEEYLSKQ